MVGPEAEAAWQFYRDLRFRYHVSPLPVEQAEMNTDTAFFTGRVAMCVNGPWMQPFLAGTTMRDDYFVVHAPRGPGGRATRVTWDALAIHDRISPQKAEAAWKFVKFACGPPGQEFVARYQRSVPALRSAAETFKQYDRQVGSRKFVDALEYARLQPITVHWSLMGREIGGELDQMLDGKKTPEQTLKDIATNPHIGKCFEMPEERNP